MNDEDADSVAQHQDAARIAARAQIQDVRLLRTKAELVQQPAADRRLKYKLDFDSSVDWDEDSPDWFVVRIACFLNINFANGEDEEAPEDEDQDAVAASEFEYAALFSCEMREGDDPIAEDELMAYGATTARFLLYPFIREYIHDTTSRLALPPLTIGVLSRPLP